MNREAIAERVAKSIVSEDREHYIHYRYEFCIGQSNHQADVYEEYTKERGLIGRPVFSIEDPKMAKVKSALRRHTNREQKVVLGRLMSMRQDNIIHPSGSVSSY